MDEHLLRTFISVIALRRARRARSSSKYSSLKGSKGWAHDAKVCNLTPARESVVRAICE